MELAFLYESFLESRSVTTDTRKVKAGDLFFALKGPTFNGNTFAEKALEMGASYVIVDEADVVKDDRYVLVDDVLTTLQQLANLHRRTLGIPILAITGSNGKTTTKELVNAVMSKKYKTYATVGNLNNHIGIPLTLLAMDESIEFGIVEMGANHQKEIASYCSFAEPNYGLINNVGKAHLEGFGGFEGVKKGKGELYQYLLETNGIAFINSRNEDLMGMSPFESPVLYGRSSDFYNAKFLKSDPFVTFIAGNEELVETKLIGDYNFDNILAALCIGKYFGVPSIAANKAIEEYDPTNNRSQIMKTEKNELILDSYNANPTSMRAAIENFASLQKANKVLILGDMYELGEESEQEHATIGALLNLLTDTKVILIGKYMHAAHKECASAQHYETKDAAVEYFKEHPIAESTILLKGSRGMGLETLVPLF
ncbi:UDP-N-acetylmuramoyl-tripeptide--D-alanyl-D-alanine ligase [Cytophaga aurantiaca]|uniref:UDP-N-acetylmuramoyl-tripeptide--D-alanyl-D- alanine ligase n=1 Tax=Cytophaga aurantiaca TaxID=29530 RepID=UPI000380C79C|nr:UDP-N-acetylmuramoyl-tripeptide--D-alanyl-D-alanine ligase [Cytophaga aurantiaca]